MRMTLGQTDSGRLPFIVVLELLGPIDMRRLDVLREWRDRWNPPEVKPVARRLAAELVAGEVRTASPFGAIEGRSDLRGLQVDLLSATRDAMYERIGAHG